MINIQKINDQALTLKSDIAGEFPIYVYVSAARNLLLYGENIVELLNDDRVKKPLKISNEGLSFLLQSGVVPPPKSIYKNVYILGIGNILEVKTVNNKLDLNFKYYFPFYNKNRLKKEEMIPSVEKILELVSSATIDKIDTSKDSFLFHSAGKDSNTIALALAEAGWQDKVTLVSHKSKGASDESEISKSIATQLGFKHKILQEVDNLQTKDKEVVDDYFKNVPFPCTDNVTLAYPFYSNQMPELKEANIIDGGGNDSYMMTPLKARETKVLPISKIMQNFQFLRKYLNSESYITPFLRTPPEWFGMNGFNYKDAKLIFPPIKIISEFWRNEVTKRNNFESIDFKTDIYSTITIAEMHIRKARNFSDSIGANLILPFANEDVANYFRKMPEEYLFNRKTLKNKLILRELLNNKINLNSDQIGKRAFTYDSHTLIIENWGLISSEILSCKSWDQKGISELLKRMKSSINTSGWSARASGRLLYRLYLISGWLNKNKWLE
jgi:asparagine synthase (glutamine-hydrolysing)